ncbi:hypothetical protein PQE75_gp070 [Bacillus phage vB_BcoS-136]|uniref:Uncharacterized protein n=1 Tax=Bacillus phage vB_BcoS-136 TaxID=2419619 RepID=A0A3G3BVC2_9CAUD|nr:hypothetical protein PQE75_gp070 [Bacillus phage vB_BcoS-136]AYP68202.1 hypothetical protein vBBcoS136_00070 [Bacillus phage vB_BcoS-136]
MEKVQELNELIFMEKRRKCFDMIETFGKVEDDILTDIVHDIGIKFLKANKCNDTEKVNDLLLEISRLENAINSGCKWIFVNEESGEINQSMKKLTLKDAINIIGEERILKEKLLVFYSMDNVKNYFGIN